MLRTLLSITLLGMAVCNNARAEIRGEIINYWANGTDMVGYLAYDDAIKGKRPGVIVVPDWWGHGKFVRDRARDLARQGYTAMVMDSYGNGKYVEPPSEAKILMDQLVTQPAVFEARFDATRDMLAKHPTVDNTRIGAIGYSLGGMVVLEMVRRGKALNAAATVWGVIGKPAKPASKGGVHAVILVQNPETDGWALPADVKNLVEEMHAAGTSINVITYPGTVHAYSREDATIRAEKYKLGIRYNAEATQQSRKDLYAFLQAQLK